MKGLRVWLAYAALLAIAAALALAARPGSAVTSPVPSVDNRTGPGLAALFTYLKETGAGVTAWRKELTELPHEARVLVIAAPVARAISAPEIQAVERFVRRGGTLVYLASRDPDSPQRAFEEWLGVSAGRRIEAGDLRGVDVTVWHPARALDGAAKLSVRRARAAEVERSDALPMAGDGRDASLWWRPLGTGEIWIGAGADLAENRRLELGDNLRFWANLAATGPLYFDEWHHRAADLPPVGRGLAWIGLQWVAVTVLFAFARGTRLGPPRGSPPERQRSTLEYLQSFAWLTRRARVERELVSELVHRLRVLIHERTGISVDAPEDDAARELAQRWNVPRDRFPTLMAEARAVLAARTARPADYARLSRQSALIERLLTGLDEAGA